MSINWEEAPEGTTHCDTSGEKAYWVSLYYGTWRFWANSGWVLMSHIYFEDKDYIQALHINSAACCDGLSALFGTQPVGNYPKVTESESNIEDSPQVDQVWCFTITGSPVNVRCRSIFKLTPRLVYFEMSRAYEQHIYKREDVSFIEEYLP